MSTYYQAIKAAIEIYPWVALFFTVFYIAWNYHKYGSVRSLRILIVYSFWLYMLCIYCLVIMPLPEDPASLSGHPMQLIPFHFISDLITEVHHLRSFHRPLIYLFNSTAFLVTIFNLFMTIPFGMYLKIYFQCSFRKTVLFSFLLSLFFELTQLSGLYFIYPGSYRLFDVDDLIVNTSGGMLGYLLAVPLAKVLPSRAAIDEASYKRGQSVSFLRRLSAFCFDLFLAGVLLFLLIALNARLPHPIDERYLLWAIPLYYFLAPLLGHGQTPGKHITSTKRVDISGRDAHWYQLLFHTVLVVLIFFIIPLLMIRLLTIIPLRPTALYILGGIDAGIYLLILLFSFIHAVTHQSLLSERLTHTKIISTVKPK